MSSVSGHAGKYCPAGSGRQAIFFFGRGLSHYVGLLAGISNRGLARGFNVKKAGMETEEMKVIGILSPKRSKRPVPEKAWKRTGKGDGNLEGGKAAIDAENHAGILLGYLFENRVDCSGAAPGICGLGICGIDRISRRERLRNG
jgi:hypothetical protein